MRFANAGAIIHCARTNTNPNEFEAKLIPIRRMANDHLLPFVSIAWMAMIMCRVWRSSILACEINERSFGSSMHYLMHRHCSGERIHRVSIWSRAPFNHSIHSQGFPIYFCIRRFFTNFFAIASSLSDHQFEAIICSPSSLLLAELNNLITIRN